MRAAARAPSQRSFAVATALLFSISATATVTWCGSMAAMPSMQMPGGWAMSMTWMRMPGRSWPGTAAIFLGMWVVMMVAMMLPALVPMLQQYRQAIAAHGATHLGRLTALVAAAYFCVWALCGALLFPLGVGLAAWAMHSPALSRAIPVASGLVVAVAGLLQFTAWKARQLACCRESITGRQPHANLSTAWRHGLTIGIHCARCCAGHTALLLVIGVMDLRAMAAVALAVSLERLAPRGERIARSFGALLLVAGAGLIARALSGPLPA